MIREISKAAALSRQYTNHSIWALEQPYVYSKMLAHQIELSAVYHAIETSIVSDHTAEIPPVNTRKERHVGCTVHEPKTTISPCNSLCSTTSRSHVNSCSNSQSNSCPNLYSSSCSCANIRIGHTTTWFNWNPYRWPTVTGSASTSTTSLSTTNGRWDCQTSNWCNP